MKKEITMGLPATGAGVDAAMLLTRPRIAGVRAAVTDRNAGAHLPGSAPGLT